MGNGHFSPSLSQHHLVTLRTLLRILPFPSPYQWSIKKKSLHTCVPLRTCCIVHGRRLYLSFVPPHPMSPCDTVDPFFPTLRDTGLRRSPGTRPSRNTKARSHNSSSCLSRPKLRMDREINDSSTKWKLEVKEVDPLSLPV